MPRGRPRSRGHQVATAVPACSSQQRGERLVQVSCSHGGGFNPQDPMAWGPGELHEQTTLSPVWPEQRARGRGRSRVGWRAGDAGGFGALDRAGGRPSERQRSGLCLRVLVWGVETRAGPGVMSSGHRLPSAKKGGERCREHGLWSQRLEGGGRGRAREAGAAPWDPRERRGASRRPRAREDGPRGWPELRGPEPTPRRAGLHRPDLGRRRAGAQERDLQRKAGLGYLQRSHRYCKMNPHTPRPHSRATFIVIPVWPPVQRPSCF